MNLIIPQGYQSALDIRETEVAIKKVKDFFQSQLTAQLNLRRVTAPLFLEPEGFDTEEYYIQGFSTSMPEDVQRALVASVPGLENAPLTRAGYAVEYDFSDPRYL